MITITCFPGYTSGPLKFPRIFYVINRLGLWAYEILIRRVTFLSYSYHFQTLRTVCALISVLCEQAYDHHGRYSLVPGFLHSPKETVFHRIWWREIS